MKLIIPDHVWQKIMWWTNKSKNEVSGFGSLDYDEKTKTFTVRNAYLLDQEVDATSAEIKPEAIGRLMYQMREEPNALKWHWHSHVDMAVFWSADDRKLISDLALQGWIVATVVNKKCEIRTAFSTVVGVMGENQEHFMDSIPTETPRFLDANLTTAWDKEFDSKVTEVKTPSYYTNYLDDEFQNWTPSVSRFSKSPATWTTGKNIYQIPPAVGKQISYDHDDDGFRYSGIYKRWIYNPVFDTKVTLSDDMEKAIKEMDEEEIEAALNYYDDKEGLFKFYYEFLLESDPPPDYVPPTKQKPTINPLIHGRVQGAEQ